MKISDKVTLLWLAIDGLYTNDILHRDKVQILYDFQDEIGNYLEENLPSQHKIYGQSVVKDVLHLTDILFKTEKRPQISEFHTFLAKLVMVAGFIPPEKQGV